MQLTEVQITKKLKHNNHTKKNHQSCKSLQFLNQYINHIQNHQIIKLCKDHKQQITFCCFDCKDICCCSKCISTGKHKNHDIKNLHRGYILVETSLNEFMIRFTTKIDLYSLWHEKLNIKKTEMIEDYTQLKKSIQNNFEELKEQLDRKNRQLQEKIQEQSRNKQIEINNILILIRNKMKQCMDSNFILQQKIQSLSQVQLCKYFCDKKSIYQDILKSNPEDFYNKDILKRPQMFLNTQKFDNIKKNINDINVKWVSQLTKNLNLVRSTALIKYQQKQCNKNSKIKNFDQQSPLYNYSRAHIQRESHPIVMSPKETFNDLKKQEITHKNRSKMKELFTCQSRKINKMFSTPASPYKDKKQIPLHDILEAQRQNFLTAKRQF